LINKEKLDQDFNNFNQEIERATEKELKRIQQELNDLKDKAAKMNVDLLGSPP
jgi:uncharacterized protein with von Willebrand factor type A (vWA) domain